MFYAPYKLLLFCDVCLHTGISAQVPIMHFELPKLKDIYIHISFSVVVPPPETCKFPGILDQRNMLPSTVKLAKLSTRPSLGQVQGMENLRGRKDFLLPFFFFFPYPFYPREAKNPDEKKTSSTRRLSLQGTALHWRSPTLSYFALSSPEENK